MHGIGLCRATSQTSALGLFGCLGPDTATDAPLGIDVLDGDGFGGFDGDTTASGKGTERAGIDVRQGGQQFGPGARVVVSVSHDGHDTGGWLEGHPHSVWRRHMARKAGLAAVALVALIGVWTLYGAAVQLRTDYQNFRKMVIWVAQQQLKEQRALQAQQAQAPVVQQP